MPSDQVIIVAQVPDEVPMVKDGGVVTDRWNYWFNLLQQFINNYFKVFTILDTTRGALPKTVFMPPKMSQVERDALIDLENGVFIFNTTSGKINYYQLGVWSELP